MKSKTKSQKKVMAGKQAWETRLFNQFLDKMEVERFLNKKLK